jgi:hypothetical protein
VALLASAVWLIILACGFSDHFAPVLTEPAHGKKVTSLETEAIEKAQATLNTPSQWAKYAGSLFVSRKYVSKTDPATQKETLIDPFDPGSAPLHPPVPNEWFLQNGLADRVLDDDVLTQDPDKDGFTNLEEYLGKTSPTDGAQHPPYYVKLRLKQIIRNRLRFKFEAESSGDGEFQINKVDGSPSLFVKLEETIPGTKYKVVKFEKRTVPNPRTGVDSEILELSVQNTESNNTVVLPIGKVVESPDQFVRFVYLYDNSELVLKKDQVFSLNPEPDSQYKLIDIKENEAVIKNLKTGDQFSVPRLE